MEYIEDGLKTIGGFEYEPKNITAEMIDELSDDDVKALLFDIGYMALNELFGGDWGTYRDVLESFNLPEEVWELLNF